MYVQRCRCARAIEHDVGLHSHAFLLATRATVLTEILCCSPVWSSLTNVSLSDRTHIDAFLRTFKRLAGYCNVNTPPVSDLFDTADDALPQSHHVKTFPCAAAHYRTVPATTLGLHICNRRHQLQLSRKTTHDICETRLY